MNNASNNSSPNEGDEQGELGWDEFDWERYLRQRDAAVVAYRRCYEQTADTADRLDEVARELGWEPTLDGDLTGDDDDEEFDDDDLDPYTLHRNPVYVATRAIFASVAQRLETEAVAGGSFAPAQALPLIRTLHEAEMAVVLGVQSLDLGDSALGISQLKRALSLLNTAMAFVPDAGAAATPPPKESTELGAYVLPRLFDLREICLRVVRECRQELQRPLDDEEST